MDSKAGEVWYPRSEVNAANREWESLDALSSRAERDGRAGAKWRDRALAAMPHGLKSRKADERDAEIAAGGQGGRAESGHREAPFVSLGVRHSARSVMEFRFTRSLDRVKLLAITVLSCLLCALLHSAAEASTWIGIEEIPSDSIITVQTIGISTYIFIATGGNPRDTSFTIVDGINSYPIRGRIFDLTVIQTLKGGNVPQPLTIRVPQRALGPADSLLERPALVYIHKVGSQYMLAQNYLTSSPGWYPLDQDTSRLALTRDVIQRQSLLLMTQSSDLVAIGTFVALSKCSPNAADRRRCAQVVVTSVIHGTVPADSTLLIHHPYNPWVLAGNRLLFLRYLGPALYEPVALGAGTPLIHRGRVLGLDQPLPNAVESVQQILQSQQGNR